MMSFEQALSKRLQNFRKHLQKVQAAPGEDNVHRFRIACRELLAAYPLLKPIAPAKRWKPFLEQAMDSLDRLRDLQQMRERLMQESSLQPSLVASVFDKALRKAEQRWHEFEPQLQSPGFILAIAATEKSLLSSRVLSSSWLSLWRSRWERCLRRTRKALLAAEANCFDSLHRLRIRYKELRYLTELLLETNHSFPVKKQELKQWQDQLGEVEDFRVMAKLALKLGLPESLQLNYQQRASQQARQLLRQRDHFAHFLTQLDHHVNHLIEGGPHD